MITLYRIDYMQNVPNYDDDPITDTYYIWVPIDEEEQFQAYYDTPEYVVTKMMEVPSDRDIELIEIACNEINGRDKR